MEPCVEVEDRGAVRIIAINRPEVRNAINMAVLVGMQQAIREAEAAGTVRALVLTGRGGAFSGGADVKEWADKLSGIDPYPDRDWVDEASRLVAAVFRLAIPTIAMIDGAAVGAGLDMALACDFRIASERAKFICAYTRVGYPPDCGGSWLMPRLIGIEAAKMFAYTGESWSAAKAAAAGLVGEVVAAEALEARTMELAGRLASGPTIAIGLTKRLIDSADRRSLLEQQVEEQRAGRICARTEDHAEGLAAANERRQPRFSGR
ncbi:MAG: enoyl-CoA hydratase-related protein [Hyphomicrobiaceae bacterium]